MGYHGNMSPPNNNLLRVALMGSLHQLGNTVALLQDDPWLQDHVRGDEALLVDTLSASLQRNNNFGRPITEDKPAHKALLDLAIWLDRAGIAPWAKNKHGDDAFDLAVQCGCAELITWLGTRPDRPGDLVDRWQSQGKLAMLANPQSVKALAGLGFDPNARDAKQATALHRAQSADMVKALMEAGADPSLQNESGQDPRAYWDIWRQIGGEERRAIERVLAGFEKPDPERTVADFAEVMQTQGITQALLRLSLCGLSVASVRHKGFTLPEMVVARALNKGLSAATVLGSGSLKDMTKWFGLCASVLNHHQKAGGQIDAGVVSAYSILLRVGKYAKQYVEGAATQIYKAENNATREKLVKYEQQIKAIVPDQRLLDVDADCAYLDRAVEEGVIDAGSPVASCLAMIAADMRVKSAATTGLLERALRENWDESWNARRGQARGIISFMSASKHLLDLVPKMFQASPPEQGPRTSALIMGLLAGHVRNRVPGTSSLLLQMADDFMANEQEVAQVKSDPMVLGCLAMVERLDEAQAKATIGIDTLVQVQDMARRMRSIASRDDMRQATNMVRAPARGIGRL